MRRTVVVLNPSAGGGRVEKLWRRLCDAVPEIAEAPRVQAANPPACRAELAEHLDRGTERVVAVGGDGTAHLVANVLLETGSAARTALTPGSATAGVPASVTRATVSPAARRPPSSEDRRASFPTK